MRSERERGALTWVPRRSDLPLNALRPQTRPTVDEYDSEAGILYLSWTTFAACPASNEGGSDNSPPPKQDDESPPAGEDDGKSARDPVATGMGFFGWFITLLFLGFAAYFVLGAYHNRTKYGATGWDMVPHRDVWRDLPYVVSDLFKGKARCRCRLCLFKRATHGNFLHWQAEEQAGTGILRSADCQRRLYFYSRFALTAKSQVRSRGAERAKMAQARRRHPSGRRAVPSCEHDFSSASCLSLTSRSASRIKTAADP